MADTVDGALIAEILTLVTATPILVSKIIVPLGQAWIARINAGTSRNIANMDIFKEIQKEVQELRHESLEDKKRIYELEKEVLELKSEKGEKDQTILGLRAELAECRGESPPTVQPDQK